MSEEILRLDDQNATDPDHPIGDPPEGSSGGQDPDPRPVPPPEGEGQ